jgi:hypothetical protein
MRHGGAAGLPKEDDRMAPGVRERRARWNARRVCVWTQGSLGMSHRGMTLVELMVGTALLVGGGGALLMGMHYALIHADYLNDFQVTMNAAQSRLEELSAQDFDTLIDASGAYAAAQTGGLCLGLDEDRNCNSLLDPEEDLNGNGVLDEPLPGGHLSVQIQPFPPGFTEPTLLTLNVSACWTSRGRAIGEDTNCNGVRDAGEDANANGFLDSPAMVMTQIADND